MFGPLREASAAPDAPVLGIDPGLSRCGYGAVQGTGAHCRAVACGVLRTDPADDLPVRLAALAVELEALVADRTVGQRPLGLALVLALIAGGALSLLGFLIELGVRVDIGPALATGHSPLGRAVLALALDGIPR